MSTLKLSNEKRAEARCRQRLKKVNIRLCKRGEGYHFLGYNQELDAWIGLDGHSPIPYSLSLEDVVDLTHEYLAEAEKEALSAESDPDPKVHVIQV